MARTRIDPWQTETKSLTSCLLDPIDLEELHQQMNHKSKKKVNKIYTMKLPVCKSPPWAFKPKSKPKPLSKRSYSSYYSGNENDPESARQSASNSSSGNENDYETATSKVLSAMSMSLSRRVKPYDRKSLELPDGDKRKNMIPKVVLKDIAEIISKVCPKLVGSPSNSNSSCEVSGNYSSPGRGPSPLQDLSRSPSPSLDNMPSSPKPSSFAMVGSTMTSLKRPAATISDSSSGRKTPLNIPPVITLSNSDEPEHPVFTIHDNDNEPPVVTIPDIPEVTIPDSSISVLPSMSKTSGMQEAFGYKQRINVKKFSSMNSEQSPTPVSIKSTQLVTLYETTTSRNSSKSITSGSNGLASYPMESASLRFSSAAILKQLSVEKLLEEKRKRTPDSRLEQETHGKSYISIPDGFLGFPSEDSKRLKKKRFHVNTNILASSLDLLDLHKHTGMPSGSPSNCIHCNIIFSSVKHCKYHQSASELSSDPSRVNNLLADGVWLCPWCPGMCPKVDFIEEHKQVCRERGRCQQVQKDSSLRKSATNSSRRQSTFPSTISSVNPVPKPSFKVVRGEILIH